MTFRGLGSPYIDLAVEDEWEVKDTTGRTKGRALQYGATIWLRIGDPVILLLI
jgi:hypothetical protein